MPSYSEEEQEAINDFYGDFAAADNASSNNPAPNNGNSNSGSVGGGFNWAQSIFGLANTAGSYLIAKEQADTAQAQANAAAMYGAGVRNNQLPNNGSTGKTWIIIGVIALVATGITIAVIATKKGSAKAA